jgi:heme-degrading monooxygenase HmoA
MSRFAPLPAPPYYAVIFTAQLGGETAGYGEMADSMVDLAARQPGYLGIESTRDETGLGITVSYWQDNAALASWKQVAAHLIAQKSGRERW